MYFDPDQHAIRPPDPFDTTTPWVSTLWWFLTHGADPDLHDHARWELTGSGLSPFDRVPAAAIETWTGELADISLADLGAEVPGIRLWQVTRRVTPPHADHTLDADQLDVELTVGDVLQAAADSGMTDEQLAPVATAITLAVMRDRPYDADDPRCPWNSHVVWETIVQLNDNRRDDR